MHVDVAALELGREGLLRDALLEQQNRQDGTEAVFCTCTTIALKRLLSHALLVDCIKKSSIYVY